MRNRRNFHFVIVFALVLFLSVGYAVVNSVTLSVTGTSTAATEDLEVYFNGTTSVSSSKVTATATNGTTSASILVKDLTLNETVTATYTVVNNETDVGASYLVNSINLSNSEYFSVTTDASSARSIAAKGTNTITVTVKMIKTPVDSSMSSSTITINLTATPKNLISFSVDGGSYKAVEGMTWGEWIDSSYNTAGYKVVINTIYTSTGDALFNSMYATVFTSDKIEDNSHYSFGTCCFDPGSKVLMADGTEKNIEDVEVGDMVMSLDEETGEYVPQKVLATIIREKSDDLVYVNLSNGTRIGMRAYHPLLTTEGWKSLRPEQAETVMDVGEVPLLKVGDTLVGYEENVTIVSVEKREHIENYNTYNLTIENTHNYIVEGVVAHNATSCPT